jgi:putative ABC transport system permease protein
MNQLFRDLRYALRALTRSPGVTIAAIVSLAIGIGANTALFSVVDGLLLRPLPYPDSGRLGLIWLHSPGLGILQDWPSPGQFVDLRNQNHSFSDMAIVQGDTQTLTGREEPVRVDVLRTSSNLFAVLGARPLLGRLLTADEDQPSGSFVAVMSHGFWQRQFGGDPTVVGRTLTLNNRQATVVGVLRPDFSLTREVMPTVGAIDKMDLYVPLPLGADAQQRRGDENYNVVVRLKPGATWAGAQSDVDAIASRIREIDRRDPTFGMTVTPLLEQVVGNVRRVVLVLFGSVALVLLVACANVANLLLARAAAREKEVAVRTALGAGRSRLIRQLLTESSMLGVLGGALGLVVAAATLWAVRTINPGDIPRLDQIGLDVRVLAFTFAVSLGTGIVFGLAPALRVLNVDLNTALKSGGRSGRTDGGLMPSRHGLRGLLVVAEVALSLMLLVGAGLLVRSFTALSSVPPGFDPSRVLSLRILLSGTDLRKPEQVAQFFARLDEAVRRVPGVSASGATSVLPFTAALSWGRFTVEGYTPPPKQTEVQVDQRIATPEYFTAMRVPLKAGRFFAAADTADSARVVVIDEKMARHFWPNESPIGKRVKPGGPDPKNPWWTIVGVVGSVKQYGLEIDGRMVTYFAHAQVPSNDMYLVARVERDLDAMSTPLMQAVRSIDSRAAIYDVASMDRRLFDSLARQRFAAVMLTAFAGFAALLAAVGIYGVMSYLVAQGTRDIGVRMALGAEKRSILGMVFRQGAMLTAAGIVIGLAGALAVTRLMASLLFGVSASDAATFSMVALLLAGVAMSASYVPARRATHVDPMIALRDE